VKRPSKAFWTSAILAVLLALVLSPRALAQGPVRVGIAVQVIEVLPDAKDPTGLTARVKADVERMLRMSHRRLLIEHHYDLQLGKAAHFLLPNGCEGDVTPMAIEPWSCRSSPAARSRWARAGARTGTCCCPSPPNCKAPV
jgi:hypothetical protein